MYLIFPTEQAAMDRNHEIAVAQGCSGTTQYWFSWIVKDPEAALVVDQPDLLTPEEVAELKDYQYMDDNGWFSNPPIQDAEVIE